MSDPGMRVASVTGNGSVGGAALAPFRSPDRAVLVLGCVAAIAIIVTGFAPTYYLRPWFVNTPLPWLLHVLGALMSAWFVLFLVQVGFIANHRPDWHRRLGIAGGALAVLIVVVGTITDFQWASRALHSPPEPGPPPLMFFGFLLFALLVFALLVGFALIMRRRRDIHSRLMLLSCISLVGPGLFRISFPSDSVFAFLGSGGALGLFGLDLIILYGCVAYDTWRNRRLHPAFLIGRCLYALDDLPFVPLFLQSGTWQQFAHFLLGP